MGDNVINYTPFNTSGRRTHHPTKGNKKGDKGRQDLEKADAPSNTGTHVGRRWEGGHTIQQKEIPTLHLSPLVSLLVCFCWMVRPPSRGFVSACPRKETRGDKGRQDHGKADTPSNKRTQEGRHWDKRGDKTLRKADTPSNKGKQEGVQWETWGDKTLGRRTHHPTKGH